MWQLILPYILFVLYAFQKPEAFKDKLTLKAQTGSWSKKKTFIYSLST
jgi:hypothetical protein